MPADVAQPGRTQQGVNDGVDQYIGIRVPQQARAVRHTDAPNDERTARHQGVAVPALTDAPGRHDRSVRRVHVKVLEQGWRPWQVFWIQLPCALAVFYGF